MKKITLLFTFVLALAVTASAQKFKLGVKGGLNFPNASDFGIDDDTEFNSSGYHAGLFASVKIALFAIQPEVLYDFTRFEIPDDIGDLESKISYVQIPVMVKFYPIPALNLQVGPRFGILTSEINEFDGQDLGEETLKSTDFSLAFGVGFDLPFGLDVHGRYNLGLSNNDNTDFDFETSNSNFQISIGYALVKKGL